MGKHIIKANNITSEQDKISVFRKLQYTQPWTFDALDLVTKQYVDSAIGGVSGFIQNQNSVFQPANFKISGEGQAGSFRLGAFQIYDDTVSVSHMLWSTGVYTYAGLTPTSGTTFDIGAFTGFVVDNTVVNNPVITEVIYPGSIGNTTPFLGTNPATFITSDKFGVITMSPTEPTEAFYRDNILLGAVAHPNGVITGVSNKVDFMSDPMDQVRDMFRPIKYINDGVAPFPNGVDLNLANTAGRLYGIGIGFVTNGKNTPSSLAIPAGAPTVFQYRTRTGVAGANTSLIDPTNYDVAGVVTPVPGGGGNATNQRVYLLENGVIRVQWGQTVYATLNDAILASNSEPFVLFANNRIFGILIGIISITKSCVNLADTTNCRILTVSKFGESSGGSAGIATGTLQTGYNNSINPEITTNSINGAVSIRRGSALDTDNVLEIQNGAGTNVIFLRADGFISTLNILSINNVQANGSSVALISFLAGNAAGTLGGDNNLVKSQAASSFLNIKGGAGNAKISIGDDSIDLIAGTLTGITFSGGANSSTNLGTASSRMFPNGNWSIGALVDNGFRFEVVGGSRFNGNVKIGTDTQFNSLDFEGPGGQPRFINFRKLGLQRWSILMHGNAETGSDAGSDFSISRYTDAGTFNGTVFNIKRSNGFVAIGNIEPAQSRLHVHDGTIKVTGSNNEALKIVHNSGYISFWEGTEAFRSGYIQGNTQDITIQHENGNKYILLNPFSGGFVGINAGGAPQAMLQVGAVNTSGVGEATWRGSIQLNHNPNSNAHGGLEFKLDPSNNGYGKRIIGIFNGAADYNLEFQSRTASPTWSTNFIITSGVDQSRVISLKNPALTSQLYTNSHFEARSDDTSVVSYGFHRAGYTAMALYHQDSSATNILRIRSFDGNDWNVWHSGNLSPVVSGIATLQQVIINGNIANDASRWVQIGLVSLGHSGGFYGGIGNNFSPSGTNDLYNYFGNDSASIIKFTSNNMEFMSAPSGAAGTPITFTSRLFINGTDGNIGIGTSSASSFAVPNRKVVTINGVTDSLLEFQQGGVFSGYIFAESGSLEIASPSRLKFAAGGVSAMEIQIDGQVAIGPAVLGGGLAQSRLHVDGRITSNAPSETGEGYRIYHDFGFISFWNSAQSARNGFIQVTGNSMALNVEQGNKYLLLNPFTAGFVGVGTPSPITKFNVDSGTISVTNTLEALRVVNNNGFISFWNTPNSTRIGTISGLLSDGIILDVDNPTHSILLAPSNLAPVGIGTFLPADKLHVIGSIRASVSIEMPATVTSFPATPGRARMWAENIVGVTEMRVMDGNGNVTTISPHNSTMIPKEEIIDDMSWFYYSERDNKRINVNMYKAIKLLEQLTGEKLIYQDEKAKEETSKKNKK